MVNLTASPDLDEHCKGESVTQMYKDLMTTAFLKYHNMVAADFQSDSPTPAPTGRKLLGFLDGVLGATGTGLGKAEALPGSAQSQTSGMRCCSHDGLDEKVDTIFKCVEEVAAATDVLVERQTGMEARITSLEEDTCPIKEKLDGMGKLITELTDKITDLEARQHKDS
ncbi:hypothetical protein SKAU_G00234240 [Synaphobranchus kaupii]|uniref:Uncharacterized protein n=1 Tax=Synaphobranchus kaupii TaxID=118154 RepID=A0A9Q1F6A6_SYNKA|nr:hypothetical protein SKAU_G00234240 [Synaphobranchus kaupii]